MTVGLFSPSYFFPLPILDRLSEPFTPNFAFFYKATSPPKAALEADTKKAVRIFRNVTYFKNCPVKIWPAAVAAVATATAPQSFVPETA